MPFTTFKFIAFFVGVFLAYYTVPKRWQWSVLLLASYAFYAFASPFYLLFLLATTVLTYIAAVWMSDLFARRDEYLKQNKAMLSRDEKRSYKNLVERKSTWVLVPVVVGLLCMLGCFKYLQFAYDNLVLLMGMCHLQLQSHHFPILLPVGLSFYVFQSIGYCIDVHREQVVAERNFFKHALFVSFFPQIMQGPIGNSERLSCQLFSQRDFNYLQAVYGLQRIVWGFFKKFMVANPIALVTDPIWNDYAAYHGGPIWGVVLLLYAIWIYADFSGYMDIACGCSQMLGIKLDENFNCPYFSKSIPEYWRRWHMTLSSWFRDYLFYPILRSDWNGEVRKSFSNRTCGTIFSTSIALAVVWFATGLWHGASWGYVAWGMYYGFFMIAGVALERVYSSIHAFFPSVSQSRAYDVVRMLRTFLIVVAGYSLFAPGDLSVSFGIYERMCEGVCWTSFVSFCRSNYRGLLVPFFSTLLLLAVDAVHYRTDGQETIRLKIHGLCFIYRWGIYVAFLAVLFLFGAYGIASLNHFAYFRF